MVVKKLTPLDDFFNTPNDLADPGSSNSIFGLGGNDTIIGSDDRDTLFGQDGNDTLHARASPYQAEVQKSETGDTLIGGDGNDDLNGSSGVDRLIGDKIKTTDDNDPSDNQDYLYGGAGDDDLRGGVGDDKYVHYMKDDGLDEINEDLGHHGNKGYGGGDDLLSMADVTSGELQLTRSGSDLQVSDATVVDIGSIDDGVEIKNFFDGGDDVVESLVTSDGVTHDLTALL